MVRVKRRYMFWAVLVATALLPASLLANKQLYHAALKVGRTTVGGSQIAFTPGGSPDYIVRTVGLGGHQVQKVWLAPADNSWQMVLCENGGPVGDDCAYASDGSGNLDISGSVGGGDLADAGISATTFINALRGGNLKVVLSDGSSELTSAFYTRLL